MIGSVMISALIVFPALTAMRIKKSFRGVIVTAGVLSVVCFILGFVLSCEFSLPVGASVVAVDLFVYVMTSAIHSIRDKKKKKTMIKE